MAEIAYAPRQVFHNFHNRSERFASIVAHRRAGKTVACVADLLLSVLFKVKHKNPRAAYIAPMYRQAKSVAWDYLKNMTRVIPGVKINEAELRVDFPVANGNARIQLFGGDNPDTLRGQYFDAVILDEFAQMNGRLWSEVVRPALADRKGTACIIGTPMGHNAFYEQYKMAVTNDEWYTMKLKASESSLIDAEEIESLKKEMPTNEFEQEFECSWQAAIRGAYYAQEMREAEEEGRITKVPYDPRMKVITSWDLGINDATVVWFWQVSRTEIRAINCLAFQSTGLPEIIKQISKLPYDYIQHIAPHDVEVRELGSGKSRRHTARELGVYFDVAPNQTIADGINAVRMILPTVYFDEEKCKDGIEALIQYRTEFDDKKQVFRDNPLHDWTSDYTDAVRYFAVTRHRANQTQKVNVKRAIGN